MYEGLHDGSENSLRKYGQDTCSDKKFDLRVPVITEKIAYTASHAILDREKGFTDIACQLVASAKERLCKTLGFPQNLPKK